MDKKQLIIRLLLAVFIIPLAVALLVNAIGLSFPGLAGGILMLAGVVYLALTTSGVSWLIPLSTIIDHGEGFFISLLLLWSFFVPEKLQEWTRVLPPSFQALKEKERLLAQMKSIQSSFD